MFEQNSFCVDSTLFFSFRDFLAITNFETLKFISKVVKWGVIGFRISQTFRSYLCCVLCSSIAIRVQMSCPPPPLPPARCVRMEKWQVRAKITAI